MLAASITLLSGCGSWWLPRAHKIDIQQGNVLPDDAVSSIAEGMSPAEVVGLLGRPLTDSSNNPDRWDYIYSLNKSGDKPDAKRITLLFEGGRVSQIVRDGFDTAGQ